MKDYIKLRVIMLADQFIETETTIRKLAEANLMSKSTVHKDLTQRLKEIDVERYKKVRKVLNKNLIERAMRGGMATKTKYEKLKKQKK